MGETGVSGREMHVSLVTCANNGKDWEREREREMARWLMGEIKGEKTTCMAQREDSAEGRKRRGKHSGVMLSRNYLEPSADKTGRYSR